MHKLLPTVKNYAWGASGEHSLVKDIYVTNVMMLDGTTEQLHKINTEKNWAEIWAGTHPSGMAHGLSGQPLTELVHGELSFLFKILSIEKCLSIQTHPDKIWAQRLHLRDPTNYPDPHPKPEMAIAIDYLEAFSGYLGPDELHQVLAAYPTFHTALRKTFPGLDGPDTKDHPAYLRSLLQHLLSLDTPTLKHLTDLLLDDSKSAPHTQPRNQIIHRVFSQFSYDVGLLVSLTLRIIRLAPLEYIALDAGVPHAYLSGNVLECMAPSDNVIRLGLTPKHKDVTAFMETFEYKSNAGGKMKPREKRYKDTNLTVLEYPNSFGEYFSFFVLTKTSQGAADESQTTWEIHATSPTVIFNLGEAVDVNEELVRRFDFFLAEPGRLDVEAEEDDVRLVIVGKDLQVRPAAHPHPK